MVQIYVLCIMLQQLCILLKPRWLTWSIMCVIQVNVHRCKTCLRDLEKDKAQLSSRINELNLRYHHCLLILLSMASVLDLSWNMHLFIFHPPLLLSVNHCFHFLSLCICFYITLPFIFFIYFSISKYFSILNSSHLCLPILCLTFFFFYLWHCQWKYIENEQGSIVWAKCSHMLPFFLNASKN